MKIRDRRKLGRVRKRHGAPLPHGEEGALDDVQVQQQPGQRARRRVRRRTRAPRARPPRPPTACGGTDRRARLSETSGQRVFAWVQRKRKEEGGRKKEEGGKSRWQSQKTPAAVKRPAVDHHGHGAGKRFAAHGVAAGANLDVDPQAMQLGDRLVGGDTPRRYGRRDRRRRLPFRVIGTGAASTSHCRFRDTSRAPARARESRSRARAPPATDRARHGTTAYARRARAWPRCPCSRTSRRRRCSGRRIPRPPAAA